MARKEVKPNGLGGWFILIIVYLVIIIAKHIIYLTTQSNLFATTYTLANSLLLLLVAILMLFSLILIFRKSKLTIKFNIYSFVFFAVAVSIMNIWYYLITYRFAIKDWVTNLIIDLVIIIYFYKSKRVKNTFIK